MLNSSFSLAKQLHNDESGRMDPDLLIKIATTGAVLATIAYGFMQINYDKQLSSGSRSTGGYTCQLSCR